MALQNLYTYHTFMEVLKILKLGVPLSLSEHFTKYLRKETTLITSFPTNDFISRSTKIWNTVAPKLKILDYSHKISSAKSSLKKSLIKIQSAGDMVHWTQNNFDMQKITDFSQVEILTAIGLPFSGCGSQSLIKFNIKVIKECVDSY